MSSVAPPSLPFREQRLRFNQRRGIRTYAPVELNANQLPGSADCDSCPEIECVPPLPERELGVRFVLGDRIPDHTP